MYQYGEGFYRYLSSFALESARRVVAKLTAVLPLSSVADFGCGQGAWLRAWSEAGAAVTGIDGPYVDRRALLIDESNFRAADLTGRIDLGGRFDLVQSVEVAEHLPPERAEDFVQTLVAHGSLVLFSAAVPGQGGENHTNEQPLSYWRQLFAARGYVAIDYLRPVIAGDAAIQPWYRYNILLYADRSAVAALPEPIRACVVGEDEPLIDYRSLACRVRQAMVRRLPASAVNRISRLRARL